MNILSEHVELGKNLSIHPSASIRGVNGLAKSIKIGDNVFIGANVQIICDEFSIGDYSKVHHDTNIHGYKPCTIGHNAWIGQFTIIDCIGGTTIGNNCGIGAHSQLWSHIKYGDTLEGCRFLGEKELLIGNDVWFVGHCIVSPIKADDKSMALVGSVVTGDMAFNKIYAGSPAKCISEKVGNQFDEVSLIQKYNKMVGLLTKHNELWNISNKIKIVMTENEIDFSDDITYFDVSTRQYKKTGSMHEISFMNYLLPDKAKFIPFK